MTDVEIRRIRPDDADCFRTIRLAALADTPSAFGSVYADEVRSTPEHWEQLARARSTGTTSANFLALVDGDAVGLIGAFREDERSGVMDLISMWVEPDRRGSGLAECLVAEVVDFAIDAGCACIELWVTVGNDRARRFYERVGFEALDDFAPLPSDPCSDEQRMRRTL